MDELGASICESRHDMRINQTAQLVLLGVLIIVALVLVSLYLPEGIDWRETYRPAALALLSGRMPYGVGVSPFFAAPWGLVPLIPLAVLPARAGEIVLFVAGLAVYALVAQRFGARPLTLILFLFSPPVIHGLVKGNIVWMSLLGFILPPQVGLFFVAIKPQIGVGAIAFWLVEALRKGGWREVIRVFWPVSLAFLASLAVFGLWPLRFKDVLPLAQVYNISFWPFLLPVGLGLLAASIRRREIRLAMAASPCLSPYVLFHGWVGPLIAILPQPVEMLAAVIGLWIVNYLQRGA